MQRQESCKQRGCLSFDALFIHYTILSHPFVGYTYFQLTPLFKDTNLATIMLSLKRWKYRG